MRVTVTDHLHEPPAAIDLDVAKVESVGADLDDWPPFIVTGIDGLFMAKLDAKDAQAVMEAMVDLAIERRSQTENQNGLDSNQT